MSPKIWRFPSAAEALSANCACKATMATPTKCLLFLLLWVALLGGGCVVSVTVCPATGEQAPDATTFMASSTDPEMEAWIVQPNCNVEVVRAVLTSADSFALYFGTTGIERVASVPSVVASLLVHLIDLALVIPTLWLTLVLTP